MSTALNPPAAPPSTVTLASIQAAAGRIRPDIDLSPVRHSAALSEMTGQQVYLKLDNHQRTGAFKERGALNKILTLTPSRAQPRRHRGQRRQPRAGRRVPRHRAADSAPSIVMPLLTPLVKVTATSGYGADGRSSTAPTTTRPAKRRSATSQPTA